MEKIMIHNKCLTHDMTHAFKLTTIKTYMVVYMFHISEDNDVQHTINKCFKYVATLHILR